MATFVGPVLCWYIFDQLYQRPVKLRVDSADELHNFLLCFRGFTLDRLVRNEMFVIDHESTDLSEEISPYLVYRLCDEQMECAVWTLNEGQRALALFLSQESAEAYVTVTGLGEDWKIYCPARIDLLEIIKQSTATGIFLAVLDPDDKKAKRLFDLRQMVNAADSE